MKDPNDNQKREPITIREVTSDDWQAYRDYYKTLKSQSRAPNEKHMYQGLLDGKDLDARETYVNLFQHTIERQPKGSYVMFGLWEGNKMAGNGSLDMTSTDENGKRIAGIQGIELDQNYQARGLVEMYGLACIQHLQQINFEGTINATIRPDNKPSLRAARLNGFVNTGELDEHGKCILELTRIPDTAVIEKRMRAIMGQGTSAAGNEAPNENIQHTDTTPSGSSKEPVVLPMSPKQIDDAQHRLNWNTGRFESYLKAAASGELAKRGLSQRDIREGTKTWIADLEREQQLLDRAIEHRKELGLPTGDAGTRVNYQDFAETILMSPQKSKRANTRQTRNLSAIFHSFFGSDQSAEKRDRDTINKKPPPPSPTLDT